MSLTENKSTVRTYCPAVGTKVKLRTWSDYANRTINIWSWLRVASINSDQTITLRVLNGDQPSNIEPDQDGCFCSGCDILHHTFECPNKAWTVTVNPAAIDPPIGWAPTYDIHVSPDKVAMVLSWFTRGIRVKMDHAMDRLSGNCYMPLDVDTAPTWGYGVCDEIRPEDCPNVFRVIAYVQSEVIMPKDRKEQRAYRTAATRAGWTVRYHNHGEHSWWTREKELMVYDPIDHFTTPVTDYMFKPPLTAGDLLSELQKLSPREDHSIESVKLKNGEPIVSWILYRASLHLDCGLPGGLQHKSGNSTWMFDPESAGDPINRGGK